MLANLSTAFSHALRLDLRLRCGGQRDRHARAHRRVQRMVSLASNQFARNEMNLRNGDKLQVIAPLLSEAEEAQVVFVTGSTRLSLLGLKFRIYVLTP